MEGAALLFRTLVAEGDRVIVEQPTYDRTLLLLGRAGAELAPAALEDDGVDVESVAAACEAGAPKLAHIIPNFHNPAGCTLSDAKRRRLVELAAQHGFLLFEDDPYRLVGFEGEASETMLDMDDADRVIHASSFSKTVSPGVRVGYLVGPADQIANLSKRASENYISPNMLAESVVWELCRSGALDANIEVVNKALAERRDALVTALEEKIPEAKFVVPGGRLLPVALAGGGHRYRRAARRMQGGERRLRRRARLHDRRWLQRAAPVLRQRAGGPGPRGHRPNRPRAGPGPRRQPRLSRIA